MPTTERIDPRAGERRLPYIQGLRGLAVLMVVAYHADLPIRGGFAGVDVFFVISGYVITRLLLRDEQQRVGAHLRTFYARRARRLLPALALTVSAVIVASAIFESPIGAQETTARVGASASLSLANVGLLRWTGGYFNVPSSSIPLLHMWSLAVEEQFYLLFPALLLSALTIRRFRTKHASVAVLTAVFVASLALCALPNLSLGLADPNAARFYLSPTRAWEFASGGLIAALALPRLRGWAPVAMSWTGLAGIAFSSIQLRADAGFPFPMALLPVAATALVIAAATTSSSVPRPLEWSWLTSVGDASYSLYLWHWPVIVFASAQLPVSPIVRPLAALAGAVVALASYRFFETPIRLRRPQVRFATARLVAACVLIPFALSGVLLTAATQSWGRSDIRTLARQVKPEPLGYSIGCHGAEPLSARRVAKCAVTEGSRRLFLLGDSNAAQYTNALVFAARNRRLSLVLGTVSSCPFVDIRIEEQGRDWSPCRKFVTKSRAWLAQQPPSVIVIAAANFMIDDPTIAIASPRGRFASTPSAKAAVWSRGLHTAVTSLETAGHTVLFVDVVPHFADRNSRQPWEPSRCGLRGLLRGAASCGARETKRDINAKQAGAMEADDSALRDTTALRLNLRSTLCPHSVCSTNEGLRWSYRDGRHISTRFSATLGPEFDRFLARAGL